MEADAAAGIILHDQQERAHSRGSFAADADSLVSISIVRAPKSAVLYT